MGATSVDIALLVPMRLPSDYHSHYQPAPLKQVPALPLERGQAI